MNLTSTSLGTKKLLVYLCHSLPKHNLKFIAAKGSKSIVNSAFDKAVEKFWNGT